MIDWEKLHVKFGQSLASKKFEDMALEYVQYAYSEYEWKQTKRTRDGNKDFHSIENEIVNIWGEAKYKKKSTSLSKKDVDPTILSGLIDGNVELIIFVTNGKIPSSIIDRTILGAKLKGIQVSFILGHQLADWLIINPEKYSFYFEEELNISEQNYAFEQSIEIQRVFFFDALSIDFAPNHIKNEMLVGDIFIVSCIVMTTQKGVGKIVFAENAPFSVIENEKYDKPDNICFDAGINIINLMVRANKEYNNTLQMTIEIDSKKYYHVTKRINIKRNNQLNVTYFEQINIINKLDNLIKQFNYDSSSHLFFIHGKSGMGKSYILKALSYDYSVDNDITLVSFEKSQKSNTNYMLLCRILVFLSYGNVFWNYDVVNLKKMLLLSNTQDVFSNIQLSNILDGCFDANIAANVILELNQYIKKSGKYIFSSKKHKHLRILLLDDIQYLTKKQSNFFKLILSQHNFCNINNIIIMAGTQGAFYDNTLENTLLCDINNYFLLEKLELNDIKATVKANLDLTNIELPLTIIQNFPSNLLIFTEVLYNLKYSMTKNPMSSTTDLLNYYIEFEDETFILYNKCSNCKKQYYLLDIIYLFKKGLPIKWFLNYPLFNRQKIKKDFRILEREHFIEIKNGEIVSQYHDYITDSYRKLRKGLEYNTTTGDFLDYILKTYNNEFKDYFLLNIICKCGKQYFSRYMQTIKEEMLKYVNASQYGAAIYFAEVFYNTISSKSKLSSDEKYFLYLYADCLVHSDNQYRAKGLLKKISDSSENYSFERYEAEISLVNQKFWDIDIEGIIEDTILYQFDLEHMYMHKMMKNDKNRFIKVYEACFNRRMVTYLLIDQFELGQKTYQEGLKRLKEMSQLYDIAYLPQIATIIMDYARGNIAVNAQLAQRLLLIASDIFQRNSMNYVRRNLICQIDTEIVQHILKQRVDYITLHNIAKELETNNFTYEYVKAEMKICACRFIDYSMIISHNITINNSNLYFKYNTIMESIRKYIFENNMILKGREKFMYNYLTAYIHILNQRFDQAKKCLLENLSYVENAGESYRIPLMHNLINLKRINSILWYQHNIQYAENIYILESRFW